MFFFFFEPSEVKWVKNKVWEGLKISLKKKKKAYSPPMYIDYLR